MIMIMIADFCLTVIRTRKKLDRGFRVAGDETLVRTMNTPTRKPS